MQLSAKEAERPRSRGASALQRLRGRQRRRTLDVAGLASDAGGSAIAPSVLLSQLNAAQATIPELHGLLGAARAELQAVVDAQQAAQDMGI